MNEEFEIYNTEDYSIFEESTQEVSLLQSEPNFIPVTYESVSDGLNYPMLTFFGVMLILLFLVLTKLGGSK